LLVHRGSRVSYSYL